MMEIAELRRVELEAILKDLRNAKTPIDNPRIERALIALIETMLAPSGPSADAHGAGHAIGSHGA